ncbi:P-loop containing nucleoside triphosphate hydrolase protein [Parasitella parasitica]|nr:P-loop containing nucleoside triphosphate hydrolase protein [Parasitella parasitica]
MKRFGAGKKADKKVIKAIRPARADWKEGTRKKQVGVSDMTLLTKITEEAINENLELRWKNGDIYVGHMQKAKRASLIEVTPHVFSIAEASYHHMNSYKENQCIIISGESGAGKTEAAKRIMQYIAAVSEGKSAAIQEIKEMVLATNPLLESFGCAKTLRNNNSSRHGKYLEIQFNAQGEPVGAFITNYLLEKNRVVGQIENERNFHIFYQLTKSAPAEYKERYGLQGPESFLYTSRSNCLDVEDINDMNDFQDTLKAMDVIGLQQAEIDDIFKMLSVILWLGNVVFAEDDQGHSHVTDADVVNFIAYLAQVEYADLNKALTVRIMETHRGGRRGSVYEVPLNITQATSVRDALAKSIYERLFEWIVARVNVSLQARGDVRHTIGVLDIYGFEIFENNNFEQLCINYVNEKLQQIFIELTLKAEQDEYVKEQIEWTPIKFFDNKVVCDLIEAKRPPGIFAALNDACATAHADPEAADNSFVQRLGFLSSNPHFESRGSQFLIRHYAGDVFYNIAGITDKNKDALLKDLLDLAAGSKDHFISNALFSERIDPDSRKRPPTASDKIKFSCNALVDKLMMCHPSYIRTIKPNDNRSSTEYNIQRVHHQIKYLGLCENIRVRRAGFAYRTVFGKFVERFYLLCPTTGYAGDYIWQGDAQTGCLEILKYNHIPPDEWQMGTSKVFIKHPETIFALEALRDKYWHNMAIRIQRAWRAHVRYKNECAAKIQRFWRGNKHNIGYLQLRDYGHQLLGGRKERRRFSLLSQRMFLGDYLDVQNGSGLAAMIRNAIQLKPTEQILLSMKGSILVPRAMRSSVPSPRTFVLTNQRFHIVVTTKNGRSIQMIEEKVFSLNVIKRASVSTLRDDWVILHLDSSPDGSDCVISCVFKTELLARISQVTNGRITVNVEPQIQYKKKGGKMVTMQFLKDEKIPRDDFYKSHVVYVPSGEPPDSQSRPSAARKSRVSNSNTQRRQPVITSASTTARVATAAPQSEFTSNINNRNQAQPSFPVPETSTPKPPLSIHPVYKAIYAFESQEGGEVSFQKGDTMEIVEKDENGWWLVRVNGKDGWAPSNYLEEYVAQKPSLPPVPPARRRVPPPVPQQQQRQKSVPEPIATPAVNRMSQYGDAVPVMPGIGAPTVNGIPAWRAALNAKNAAAQDKADNTTPIAAGRAPQVPAKPAVPFKPAIPGSKPDTSKDSLTAPSIPTAAGHISTFSVPGRPQATPSPQAPPRNGNPAALSLADAIKARRQQALPSDDDDEDW